MRASVLAGLLALPTLALACGDDGGADDALDDETGGDEWGPGPEYPDPGELIWRFEDFHTLLGTGDDGRTAVLRAASADPQDPTLDALWLDPEDGSIATEILDWPAPDYYDAAVLPGLIVEPDHLLLPGTDLEDLDAGLQQRLEPDGSLVSQTRALDTASADRVLTTPSGDTLLLGRLDGGRRFLARIDPGGTIIWQRDLSTGDFGGVAVSDVAVDTDGAIVAVGYTLNGGSVPRVIEFDPNTGDTFIEQVINAEITLDRVVVSAGDLYVAGFSAISMLEPRTPILSRINPDGVVVWSEPTGPAIDPNEPLNDYTFTLNADPVGQGACMTSWRPTVVDGNTVGATGSAVCLRDDREVVWSHVATEPEDAIALKTWSDGDGDLYVQFGLITPDNAPVGTRVDKLGNPFR